MNFPVKQSTAGQEESALVFWWNRLWWNLFIKHFHSKCSQIDALGELTRQLKNRFSTESKTPHQILASSLAFSQMDPYKSPAVSSQRVSDFRRLELTSPAPARFGQDLESQRIGLNSYEVGGAATQAAASMDGYNQALLNLKVSGTPCCTNFALS
ncbi:unnamed protein product [Protopolystoma xenopodis]|uniref:Uncharacterized protein n=1 Tax=Protopolystoma xenopodis TaxID=117903 RepID=A0A448WMA5_9PLAT|nr:unnamed protein product [Protopolystoma xenopodis]